MTRRAVVRWLFGAAGALFLVSGLLQLSREFSLGWAAVISAALIAIGLAVVMKSRWGGLRTGALSAYAEMTDGVRRCVCMRSAPLSFFLSLYPCVPGARGRRGETHSTEPSAEQYSFWKRSSVILTSSSVSSYSYRSNHTLSAPCRM